MVTTTREQLDYVEEMVNEKFNSDERQQVIMALEVMWYCGLRPCECFALNKSDIKNGYIAVGKELGSPMVSDNEITRSKVVRICKTDASIRNVPIPKQLQALLDNYSLPGKILFPNKNGGYFDTNVLDNWFNRLNVGFWMYQLRHTVASWLVKNRVDERTIIEILGHESFNMSIYYARSDEKTKLDALELE